MNMGSLQDASNIIRIPTRQAVCYFDIWIARLPLDSARHVQGGIRPVLVVSGNQANSRSSVVSVIPLTSKRKHMEMSTHICLTGYGLRCPSVVLVEQITTIDKRELLFPIGHLSINDGTACAIRQSIINFMALAA